MQHRRDDFAGLIFESQIIAEAFNVGTLQCSPSFQFRKLNRGVIEIGFGEIAIDLLQARLHEAASAADAFACSKETIWEFRTFQTGEA